MDKSENDDFFASRARDTIQILFNCQMRKSRGVLVPKNR